MLGQHRKHDPVCHCGWRRAAMTAVDEWEFTTTVQWFPCTRIGRPLVIGNTSQSRPWMLLDKVDEGQGRTSLLWARRRTEEPCD